MSTLTGGIGAVVLICLYFLPAIVARKRVHYDGILLLNVFLGWTFIFWVVALIWAVSSPEKPSSKVIANDK